MGSSWTWRKSSASDGGEEQCVEAAWTGETVLVRDSARRGGSVLALSPQAWTAFLGLAVRPSPAARPRDEPAVRL